MISKLFGSVPQKEFSRKTALAGVPVIAPGITRKEGPEGEMLVLVPRKLKLFKFLRKFMDEDIPPAKVVLDELGAKVMRMIDGRANVAGIIKRFGKEMSLHPREAEVGVVEFLKLLMNRGIVMMMVDKDGVPPGKA